DYNAQLEVLRDAIAEGFNIYHFWQRSLVFSPQLDGLTGLDLPIIKSHGARIFHRFTGFDLRMPTQDRAFNRFSPFHYGYESPFPEQNQLRYIDMLREYVDQFFVQDPELQQFLPEATILPRGLELDRWEPVGVAPTARPLIVHAPSNSAVKGSREIIKAFEDLKHDGLSFEFKLLDRVPHEEAREWYRRADIIVDQINIGATGVLTLEAWALGKPCVTYLRPDLFEPFYDTSELPVANGNPDNIKQVLKSLIKDYEWRRELSHRGRALVEKYHDIEVVAVKYKEILDAHLADCPGVNTRTTDLDFFRPHLAELLASRLPLPLPGSAEPVGKRDRPPRHMGRLERSLHNFLVRTFEWLVTMQDHTVQRLLGRSFTGTLLHRLQLRALNGLLSAQS
ncbi:MAG: glycosyltransferase, partial [Rhodobacteraceae bacterium]|nr:glycosyltransferase [Paracoccaceae bacterium]